MRISPGRCRALLVAVIILTFGFCPDPARGQQATVTDEKPLPPASKYVPMTAEDRWNDYVRQNFAQPGVFFQTFFTALGDQTGNVPLEWGKGVDKFPQRLGSEFARFTIGGTIKSTIAAGLHEDTRFYSCLCRGAWARTIHAVSRTLLTYNQDGKWTLDIAGLAGIYGGPMVMTTWYPSRYTALGYGVRQGTLALGITTGIDVIREFSPELKRLFRHTEAKDMRTGGETDHGMPREHGVATEQP
jgi:hypothetical protein